jgi:hypothetical protein
MMENLLLDVGEIATVSNVALPPGTYAKFEPQSLDFLEIANPKAVLAIFPFSNLQYCLIYHFYLYKVWRKASGPFLVCLKGISSLCTIIIGFTM